MPGMSLVQRFPNKDVAFFRSVAEVSDAALLTSIAAVAGRRDWPSLRAAVQFLNESRGELPVFDSDYDLTVYTPKHADDMSPGGPMERGGPMALLALALPTPTTQGQPLSKSLDDDALAFVRFVANTLGPLPDDLSSKRHRDIQRFWHRAVSLIDDERLFHVTEFASTALISAKTRAVIENDDHRSVTNVGEEALTFGHFQSALGFVRATQNTVWIDNAFNTFKIHQREALAKGVARSPEHAAVWFKEVERTIDQPENVQKQRNKLLDEHLSITQSQWNANAVGALLDGHAPSEDLIESAVRHLCHPLIDALAPKLGGLDASKWQDIQIAMLRGDNLFNPKESAAHSGEVLALGLTKSRFAKTLEAMEQAGAPNIASFLSPNGDNALHQLAQSRHFHLDACANVLMQRGVSVTDVNAQGRTPEGAFKWRNTTNLTKDDIPNVIALLQAGVAKQAADDVMQTIHRQLKPVA